MQEVYNNLMLQLEALRKKGNAVTLYDISAVLDDIAKCLGSGQLQFNTLYLQQEIIKIANHIDIMKRELISLMPAGELANKNISQLEAVIRATEEAAGTILDAADEVQRIVNASGASDEAKNEILKVTTRIYEACSFQDLTGQRIVKVMRELDYVETKIRGLIKLFSHNDSVHMEEVNIVKDMRPDQHLMNGPQLPGDAPVQTDVDAMFREIE